MFQKCAFKNSPTFVLAACVIFTSCNCAVAQSSASFGHIRSLPAIDTETIQEAGKAAPLKAAPLFAIKEKKPLPPAIQFSKARIVRVKSLVPPEAQTHSNVAPPAPSDVAPPAPSDVAATPITRVALPQSNVAGSASPTNIEPSTSHYTISFAQPYKGPQSEEDLNEFVPLKEPDSAEKEPLETDDPDDVDEDLDTNDVDELDLSGDEESADELDYDEDDSPLARPEIGPWPKKSIQEVRFDLAEHGAEAPEDRANKLFESSRRFDGNIAASEKVFAWAAPNINYQPLYFEDVALERYGQTKGLVKQPFVSAGKFLADRLFLGARALRVCPHSCDSPLGFCRPGSPSTVADGGCGCACWNSPQEDCKSCR